MKICEHKELGIYFTSKNIKNINDMIDHIRSINIDYNIVTVFLFLSEKYYLNKEFNNSQNTNININNAIFNLKLILKLKQIYLIIMPHIIKQNILCEDISKNCINDINVDK